MNIRAKLQAHPRIAAGIAVASIVIALGTMASSYMGGETDPGNDGSPKTFFTVDDGVTFFVDDALKVPPFEHNGKKAYGCWVYENHSGKRFVSVIYRYTPEGKRRQMEGQLPDTPEFAQDLREFKKPGSGEGGWVKATDSRIVNLLRPPTVPGKPDPVLVQAE